MFKKIILGLLGVLVVVGATLFVIQGKDNYDASKYSATVSNGLEVGSKVSFTLPDQFDKSHSISNDTQILILSFAKESGHMVTDFLKTQDKNFLNNKNAFFIADINLMPVVIRNTFALPSLKKNDFSVLLIYEAAISKQMKQAAQADKVAVVSLKNGIITAVKYVSSSQELQDSL